VDVFHSQRDSTDAERVAAKKARLVNQEAMQRISEWRAERREAQPPEAASGGSGR